MASFAEQMQKWALKTQRKYNAVVEDAYIMLSTAIIERTPIGDPSLWKDPPPPGYQPGRLIANWHSSLNSPLTTVRRAQDPSAAGSRTQALKIAKVAAGNVAYFVNPTPYANRIEFSIPPWSSQAPAGMVRVSVREFQAMVRKAIRANR